MRPFIRRVITQAFPLREVEYLSARWAREVWRSWRRGFTSFDLGAMWEESRRVCPFCFFVSRASRHPEEPQREMSARAAKALRACRCTRSPVRP